LEVASEDEGMLAEQRRQRILGELEATESISVANLCDLFGVSDMTIRRDLDALDKRKLLQKVHGGAVRVPKAAIEPHFEYKRKLNLTEKKAMTLAALRLIDTGDTVAFSAGTTTWHIADALRNVNKDLTFITNSTNIALKLQENGWQQIILSGGIFRTPSDALVGPYADRILGSLNADILFLGTHGAHASAGLTTPNVAEAETDGTLIEMAQKVVVVADHSKLGVIALAKIAPIATVDILITDEKADAEVLREIELLGVQIMVVDSTASPDGLSNT
jgi:DeoR/GlpR family transcriptional regulator of sugar metabolism